MLAPTGIEDRQPQWNRRPSRRASTRPRPRLWAVGGGKGGVGKSVVASSLAVAFAARGRRCVLVDADLGAANLHTLLGMESPNRTLAHFLTGEAETLREVVSSTPVPNVELISGAQALLDMANPMHGRKMRLIRNLSTLAADEVFLDLGAGSSFNVLDFFVCADRGMVVIEPEPTSIDNAYHFLKAAFFRSLRAVTRTPSVRQTLDFVLAERSKGKLSCPRDIISAVSRANPEAGKLLLERAAAFAPMLIVNQARGTGDRELGHGIERACEKLLGTRIDYRGALDWDESVARAVRERRPVGHVSQSCPFWRGIETLAEGLLAASPRAAVPAAARIEANASGTAEIVAVGLPRFDPEAPGDYLRRCREHLGLSIEDLRSHTRIRGLEHIEKEDFELLPPAPYVRGFVRTYARALGIPRADALAEAYVSRFVDARRRAAAQPGAVAQRRR